MRVTLFVYPILLLALILVGPTYGPDANEPLTPDQLRAAEFRESFGLPADATSVRIASSGDGYSSEEYGVPLSVNELKELERRAILQAQKGPAIDFAMGKPGFAGVYTDQRKAGEFAFRFTGDPSTYESEIRARLPREAAFRLERVDNSLAELTDLKEAIVSRWDELRADGVRVTRTSVDVTGNQVVVGVYEMTASKIEQLHERFGSTISVVDSALAVADACNSVHDCRPIKGGLHIESSYDGGDCTSGFVSKRSDTGGLVIVTAGHCIEVHETSINTVWRHNADGFGHSKYETWFDDSLADVGLISIVSDETPTYKNEVYVGAGNVRKIVSWSQQSWQSEGDQVFRFGLASGYDGGLIVDADVANESCVGSDCRTITRTVEVDFDSTSGDSGGPIIGIAASGGVNRIALGTHVHSDPDTWADPHGWYSPIDQGVSAYLGVAGHNYSVCTSSSC